VLSTKDYLYGLETDVEHTVELEPGVTLLIELEAISEADERGFRTVLTTLNGHLRPVVVRDESITTDVKAARRPTARTPRTSPPPSPASSPCRWPRATGWRTARPSRRSRP
jgi:pyruvate carboxylase